MKISTKLSLLNLVLALSIVPVAGSQALAQKFAASDKALPSVDEIVEANIAALGGRAAIEKVNSRISKGTAEIIGFESKGTIEVYEKAPNKLLRIVKIPGAMTWAAGCDGSAAWWFNAETKKIEDRTGEDLTVARDDADFYQALKFKERFPKRSVVGVQKIQYRGGEREVYVVETAPKSPEKYYFDTENNLLIRHDFPEDAKTIVREFYLDYTEVDGVKVPFTIRINEGNVVVIWRFTEVEHNVPIADGRFNKPGIR